MQGAKIERCRILSCHLAEAGRWADEANDAFCAAIGPVYGAASRKLDPLRREYFRGFFRISRKESFLTKPGNMFEVRRLSEPKALARARHSGRPAHD
jgi:hypothetical protein